MKLALAQTKPITGNISANIIAHEQFILNAVTLGADAIFFSELSLTGYEPALAGALALSPTDARLTGFKALSERHEITIAVGAPLKTQAGTIISLLIFQPGQSVLIYGKQYLHPDEEPWFVPGNNLAPISINDCRVGLAICYELSVEEHFNNMKSTKPDVYIASVAKFSKGIEPSYNRLASIASTGVHALFVNAVGTADNGICAGGSAVWNKKGELLAKLDDVHEGLLIFNSDTEEVLSHKL
ncbi:MAG TPA: carbon-nitrogen hydrolase family protein [Cyclobacteriaceae bacterium]|nr:carbon-nitrogen hydrolase family protein [Cyclobacteriaceae bacterium]